MSKKRNFIYEFLGFLYPSSKTSKLLLSMNYTLVEVEKRGPLSPAGVGGGWGGCPCVCQLTNPCREDPTPPQEVQRSTSLVPLGKAACHWDTDTCIPLYLPACQSRAHRDWCIHIRHKCTKLPQKQTKQTSKPWSNVETNILFFFCIKSTLGFFWKFI